MILERLCNSSKASDECYTPYYAVDPLLEFIGKDKTIWCPFDKEWSAYVQTFKANGNRVIYSHIDDGKDFFSYEPESYDLIVSNPPFSLSVKVFNRLYNLNKPFCVLSPVKALQGKQRFDNFAKKGLELLVFDGRVDFHTRDNFEYHTEGNHFGSMYFCRNVLPEKLVFRKLLKYTKPLK